MQYFLRYLALALAFFSKGCFSARVDDDIESSPIPFPWVSAATSTESVQKPSLIELPGQPLVVGSSWLSSLIDRAGSVLGQFRQDSQNIYNGSALKLISLNVFKDTPMDKQVSCTGPGPLAKDCYQSFDNELGEKRKSALRSFAAAHRNTTDIFLFQEVSPNIAQIFNEELGCAFGRVPEQQAEEVIYFRKTLLSLEQSSTKFPAPGCPGVVAKFRENSASSADASFVVMGSVHPACDCGHRSEGKIALRQGQMKAVGDKILEMVGNDKALPMILGGDLNDHDPRVVHGCLEMRRSQAMVDANISTYPTHISADPISPQWYDWIVSSGVLAVNVSVYPWVDASGIPPSDHMPMHGDFFLHGSSGTA